MSYSLNFVKIFVLLFVIMINFFRFNTIYATDSTDIRINDFLKSAREYSSDFFPELTEDNMLENVINGKVISEKNVLGRIKEIFAGEVVDGLLLISKIICACIFCGILKNIQNNSESGVGEIAFYVCYIFVVILIIKTYADVAKVCETSMSKLCSFMNVLMPLILTLLILNGGHMTVTMMQPVTLIMTNVVNLLITKLIFPIILVSMILVVVGNLNENLKLKKLPEMLQKTSVWFVNLLLGIFVGILSIEGTLAANVDGFTVKTAKTVVSTVIPVVGKALSDATDSIIGAASVTKNAIGVVGILTIISIVLTPIIKVLVIMLFLNFAGAIIEPLADGRMITCINSTGKTMKVLFALMCTVGIIFIISISLMIKAREFYIDV